MAYQELMNRTPDIVNRANAIEKELKARAESLSSAQESYEQDLATQGLEDEPAPVSYTHLRAHET